MSLSETLEEIQKKENDLILFKIELEKEKNNLTAARKNSQPVNIQYKISEGIDILEHTIEEVQLEINEDLKRNFIYDYNHWLQDIDITNFDDAHVLWTTLTSESNQGSFAIISQDQPTLKWYVKEADSDSILEITDNEKIEFISKIETKFGGEIGMEATYSFNKEMNKNN